MSLEGDCWHSKLYNAFSGQKKKKMKAKPKPPVALLHNCFPVREEWVGKADEAAPFPESVWEQNADF